MYEETRSTINSLDAIMVVYVDGLNLVGGINLERPKRDVDILRL